MWIQKVIGANYETHISLIADAKLTLIELNKKIKKINFEGKKIVKEVKKKKFKEFNKLCNEDRGFNKTRTYC